MKLRSGLVGVSAAMVFALAAQAAEASTQQCPPSGGGGDQQIEVGGEPCPPMGGYASFALDVENANGVSYTATGEVLGGEDYLEAGDVIEVEIEYDDVMAALKSDEQSAIEVAEALGMRSPKVELKADVERIVSTKITESTKLTDAELVTVANYVHTTMQRGRATGRSEPARDNWTTRIEAFGQAFGRAMDSIGRNLPRLNVRATNTQRNARNVVVNQQEVSVTLEPSN